MTLTCFNNIFDLILFGGIKKTSWWAFFFFFFLRNSCGERNGPSFQTLSPRFDRFMDPVLSTTFYWCKL